MPGKLYTVPGFMLWLNVNEVLVFRFVSNARFNPELNENFFTENLMFRNSEKKFSKLKAGISTKILSYARLLFRHLQIVYKAYVYSPHLVQNRFLSVIASLLFRYVKKDKLKCIKHREIHWGMVCWLTDIARPLVS